MKLLLLLTTTFPYDNGEEFIANELEQAKGFDKILVCPCNLKANAKQTKTLPDGVETVPIPRKTLGSSIYPRLLLRSAVQDELFRLFRTGRLQPGRAHELLFFMKNVMEIYNGLKEIISVQPSDHVVIYSYWLYDAAAAGVLLVRDLRKKGVKVRQISRAHGFDIHSERSKYGYLPMRSYLFRNLDSIFPCSDDGAGVLKSQAGENFEKIRCSYLGTRDYGAAVQSRTPFHLVSCSYMVAVKRLHLIAETLKQADFPVLWTHIGSGPLEDEIRSLAKDFPPQVQAEFLGQRGNEEIMDYYKSNPVSVFVNVSSSEGIPVSVMEACSFGIPVIATDVGGTHEIVSDGENGFLIPKDFSPHTLLDSLRKVRSMDETDYSALCRNSRKMWEEKLNAEENYRKFYSEIGSGI